MDIGQVQKVNLYSKEEVKEVENFLKSFGLNFDKDIDYSIVIRNNNTIIATCSKAKSVLKCFAIDSNWRGEGITSTLVSHLIDRLFEEGIYHSFIFTKPENIAIFTSLNYTLIHKVKEAALLENGIFNINSYLNNLIKKYSISSVEKAAIVMNCNPFTLGHQYLIERVSSENQEVLIFVVEEDKSIFPFNIRYKLVKEGTKHLCNVKVIPGGEYIISQATFPTYFIKEENIRLKTYTELDANIFSRYFCEKLNIKRRYVGNEPFCRVTNAYNKTLQEVLKNYNIEFRLVQRIKSDGIEISATAVRKFIRDDDMNQLEKILPQVTIKFLNSKEGTEIIEKIKSN